MNDVMLRASRSRITDRASCRRFFADSISADRKPVESSVGVVSGIMGYVLLWLIEDGGGQEVVEERASE